MSKHIVEVDTTELQMILAGLERTKPYAEMSASFARIEGALEERIKDILGPIAYFEPELRCEAGQTEKPNRDTCNRHADHHWCKTCLGWYGVPHDRLHAKSCGHDGVTWTAGCACRPCRAMAESLASAAREGD